MRKIHWLILAFVSIFGLLIHSVGLLESPRGLFLDEFSIGLNGASIAQTGLDEHGVPMPVYFEAFGEYKNPVYIYTNALLTKAFGVSDWTIRFTSVVFFAIALFAFAALIQSEWRKPWLTILAIALFSTTPFLFTVSRVGFEVISHVAIMAITLLLLRVGLASTNNKAHLPAIALAGICSGLSIYTYSTARLLSPLLIIFVLIVLFANKRFVHGIVFGAMAALAIIPFATIVFTQPEIVFTRFNELTEAASAATSDHQVVATLKHYMSYFSFDFLALHGDPNLRHHSGYGGMLGFFALILMVLGLLSSFLSKQRSASEIIMWFVLITTPIAAALTGESHHALRVLIMVIPLLYFVVKGVHFILELDHVQLRRGLVALLVSLVMLESAGYLWDWFNHYSQKTTLAFRNHGAATAITQAIDQGIDHFFLSPYIQEHDTLAAFYRLEYPTATFDIYDETKQEPALLADSCVLHTYTHRGIPIEGLSMTTMPFPDSPTVVGWCYY